MLGEVAPGLVNHPAGGPPPLAEGQKSLGFSSDYAEALDLGPSPNGSGQVHAVVESVLPMALETEEGKYRPLDLNLHAAAGGFEPAFGLAPVRLPMHAEEGASVLDSGVSLTPVTEAGAPLAGNGVVDHAGVFYGNTENEAAGVRDLSSFAKPTVGGFEWYDVLFSERSPEHLYFKVGLPEGAGLSQDGLGNVQVVREGKAIAVIPKPAASDAEGTPVATTVSLSGDVLEVSVPRKAGAVRYPVIVDPEDKTLLPYLHPAWVACASSECPIEKSINFEVTEFSDGTGQYAALLQKGAIKKNEWVAYQYKTQGNSKIYALEAETQERDYLTETSTLFEFYAPGSEIPENEGLLANNVETTKFKTYMCAVKNVNTCEASQGANGNKVEFIKRILAEGAGGFEDRFYTAIVYISQTEAPVVTFNTTSQKIQIKEPNGEIVERENILYPGSKGWIGPHSSTAFEMTAKDPGVGISFAVADGNTWSREVFLKNEGLCKGSQCPSEYVGKYTYYTTTPGFTSPMPSGEYEIQGRAEDEAKLTNEKYVKVRVDATAPEAIKLVGLPAGNQFGEGVYKIKAEATDGKTGTPSSGVASLKLGIDGAEAGEPKGSCPSGPCTASAEWTINGGQLSAGPHTLTIVATDNAGNVSHEDFVIFIHHAAPMALGLGSLDPQSGNYTLGGTDVSMGRGLTLVRAYSSRNLTAGAEGGLGPQWSMSLAGSESLEELADGNMVLITANGGETVFEKNSKGEFEAPKGDTNITLSPEVNEKGVPVAYYVKNVAAGSTMKFARASGYLQTAPTYYGEIGWQGPGTGQLNTPMGVASDAKGNAWVADTKNNRIEKFNADGEYVSQFGFIGTGNGALKEPRGVAIDAKGNIWVADTGNNRIEEFNEKGEFIRTAGTEGAGALKGPQGIATDASGNVWVVDTSDNRAVEFKEKGEYLREAAKTVGTLALAEPVGVAVDTSGDPWVTDAKNHRFVEFSPTGASLKEFGKEGSGNGEFKTPAGIAIDSENDVYVDDYAANRVQEFNAKGEFLTKFGSVGANGAQFKAPYLMGIDVQGALLIADSENSRVHRWAHSAWLPSVSEGASVTSQVSYMYKAVRAASGTLIEPTEVVAPHASELSCFPTIKKGCRALFLKYAEKTTATGEGESQWGEYEGRLSEVFFAAYNPATKLVEEKVTVARYSYDAKGRLRAEWDPRVKPEQKTIYGYDAEGHVTAVSPANQEPWLIHYGTIPSDTSAGRVLSAIRPAASTEIGSRTAPANTARPTLSSSEPKVGIKISVSSNGTWSNNALTYSYQWQRCNTLGLECVAIAGAVNEAYYPTTTDEKHTLVVQVTAINAGGSTLASSTATGLVGAGTPNSPAPEPPNPGTNSVTTVEYAVPLSGTGLPNLTESEVKKWGQEDDPVESAATAVFPPDKPMGWPAKEYERATISYFDAQGRTVNVANPSGGISTAEYNATNNEVRSLSPDNRALALKEGTKSAEVASKLDSRKVYNEEGDELLETLGPEHKVKLPTGSEVQARHRVKYVYDQNAPKGQTYRLVTETIDSALVGGREEDQRITQTHYYGQKGLGWELRKPTSVTVDPYGLKTTTTTVYDKTTGAVIETGTAKGVQEKEITEKPNYVGAFGSYGTGNGQLREPEGGLATDASGNVWVSDTENSRLEEFNNKGEYVKTAGSSGEGAGQFKTTYGVTVDSKGNVWATDEGNNRVEEFTAEGTFVKMFGWGVANGEAKLQTCTSSCRAGLQGAGNGEFYVPEGIVVDSKGNIFVADRGNHRVQEFSESLAWVRNFSKPEEKEGPFYLGLDSTGNLWVAYSWDKEKQIGEFNTTEGKLIQSWGTEGSAAGQLKDPYGVTVGAEGDLWISEYGNNRVQVFTPAGEYLYGFGSKGSGPGQFNQSPHGLAFSGSNVYVLDSGIWWENTGNSRIEKWQINHEIEGTETSHDKQAIYYTAAANSQYPTCGGHVEWEGMPCITRPGAQPTGSQAPSLPTTTVTSYNMWGEPETTTEIFPANEKFAETTRTKKITYDEAGRPQTSEELSSSTANKTLPKVTSAESVGVVCGQTKTVRCVMESTTEGETTRTITSIYDTLGRLIKYTDADNNTTTYEYETSGDGRLLTVSDPKSYQDYAYDPTTGMMTKLLDSGAKTFESSYDVEGNMTTETYPNGMTATYTRDQVGQATGIEYVKTTHCTEKCVWFNETSVPSIHGETISRSNTLTNDAYTYDAVGRLIETTETPAGKGCTTRLYGYEEDSNRTSLTTREPGIEGKCATTGGTTETHTYDEGDRLTDTGIAYDPLGNITKLPEADAGGYVLTSTYYVDGQVEKQLQNGQENVYSIDPAGRVRESVGKGTSNITAISHYAGSGEALSWKDEQAGKYTRLIPGPDGSLCGTETNGEAPILQLHDLQGDIVATAALAETETKLLNTYNSTEFGVPSNGTPPTKYSWLGAAAVSSELSSGELLYGTVAYQPQLGRALQTEPVIPPGMAVNGATSETTAYTAQVAAWEISANNATGEADTLAYEQQKAAEEEADEKACAVASECVVPETRIVDPAILLTTRQAEVLAAALRKGPGEVKELALSGIIGSFTMEIAELIVQITQKYMDGMAYGLERCVRAIHSAVKAHARCRLYIGDEELGEGGKKITLYWGVETCWGKEHDLAGKRFWTFPYCHT